MPLGKGELRDRVVVALAASGAQVFVADPEHPFRLAVRADGLEVAATVYIYNVTHGGGTARPAAEQRIQITHPGPVEAAAEGDRLLLLGFKEDADLLVAFDPDIHQGDHGHSASLQVSQAALDAAAEDGFAVHRRMSDEIAVAFQAELLGPYLQNQQALHDALVADEQFLASLTKAVDAAEAPLDTRSGGEPSEADAGQAIRERVTRAFTTARREHDFRQRVVPAYGDRCAACGLQLDLVEAAHIIPVALGGTDETRNGIALCPLHHKAYDAGVLRILPDGAISTRDDAIDRLTESGLVDGLDEFRAGLRDAILQPTDPAVHPDPIYLEAGDQLRERQ